jgi:hypothetical protein
VYLGASMSSFQQKLDCGFAVLLAERLCLPRMC